MSKLPSFEQFNESLKVADINEGVFHRLPKNIISDELYLTSKNLTNFYDRTAAGNDVDPGVIDTIIKGLDKVKKAVKKFNSKEEVLGTVYESEELNEGDKVVLGDGKLTPIKRGDKLKFTDKAKEDKGGQMGRLNKKYLDDTLEFEYMAGSALHVKTSDGTTFIIDPSRFIKESEEVNEDILNDPGAKRWDTKFRINYDDLPNNMDLRTTFLDKLFKGIPYQHEAMPQVSDDGNFLFKTQQDLDKAKKILSTLKESEVNEASVQVAGNSKPAGAKVLATVIIDMLDKQDFLHPDTKKSQKQLIDMVANLIMDSTF